MKTIKIFLPLLLLLLLAGCGGGNDTAAREADALPLATELADPAVLEEICQELEAAGLSHVDVFRGWVEDYVAAAGSKGKLTAGWVAPEKLHADVNACMDGWDAMFDETDCNCRMTAFLLLDGLLTAERTEPDYRGTYLMFDLDAIDTGSRYAMFRPQRELFTTLYGEHPPQEGEAMAEIYPRVWRENGIRLDSDRVSLLTVGIQDTMSDQIFVGHGGLLIDRGDELLLLEKVAFGTPYQATRLADRDQLLDLLRTREEYFGGAEETGPLIYENDTLLGELAREE